MIEYPDRFRLNIIKVQINKANFNAFFGEQYIEWEPIPGECPVAIIREFGDNTLVQSEKMSEILLKDRLGVTKGEKISLEFASILKMTTQERYIEFL